MAHGANQASCPAATQDSFTLGRQVGVLRRSGAQMRRTEKLKPRPVGDSLNRSYLQGQRNAPNRARASLPSAASSESGQGREHYPQPPIWSRQYFQGASNALKEIINHQASIALPPLLGACTHSAVWNRQVTGVCRCPGRATDPLRSPTWPHFQGRQRRLRLVAGRGRTARNLPGLQGSAFAPSCWAQLAFRQPGRM